MNPKNCLITGGAGFVGAHLVKYLLEQTDWNIHVLDKMSYASRGGERLVGIGAFRNPRFTCEVADVANLNPVTPFKPNYIVHLAAETHVERSIRNPSAFLMDNVAGTYGILQYARQQRETLEKFLYFSTDEVFGPSATLPASEWFPYRSGNPYAATKAAGEEFSLAWRNTYGVPTVISHCSNIFGEWQHEEKFIPKLVRKISAGETVTIHADNGNNVGSRMYVYVQDVAHAIEMLLRYGDIGQKYNIPGREFSNLEMAQRVADILNLPLRCKLAYPHGDRPGWDFSYRIDGTRLLELGWQPIPNFDGALRQVVQSICAEIAQKR